MEEEGFGLTVVYADPDATVDIVLVHGLHGDPWHTWTAETAAGGTVFWPTELLPTTLKGLKVRILVYGYNAAVYTFWGDRSPSSDFLYQHAQTLLVNYNDERRSENMERNAIIWVAHSLGGILLKKALLLSKSITDFKAGSPPSIYVSTYGIIFLGTPHRGASGATLALMLQRLVSVSPRKLIDTEKKLLYALEPNNETLQNINEGFDHIQSRFEMDMVWESAKMDLKGTKMVIVDSDSAAPTPGYDGARKYGVEATHIGMCKFRTKNSPGYLSVSQRIKEWVRECEPKIEDRRLQEQESRAALRRATANETLGLYGSNDAAFNGFDRLGTDGYPPRSAVPQMRSGITPPPANNATAINYGNTNQVYNYISTSNAGRETNAQLEPSPLRSGSVPRAPSHAIYNEFSPQIIFSSRSGADTTLRNPETRSMYEPFVWDPSDSRVGLSNPESRTRTPMSSVEEQLPVADRRDRSSWKRTADGREKRGFLGIFRRG